MSEISTLTQHTDSPTHEAHQNESEDDLFETYKNAPNRYIIATPDKTNDENSNKLCETEQETSPQNLPESLPKTLSNLYKHKTSLKYRLNLHQHKNYPS